MPKLPYLIALVSILSFVAHCHLQKIPLKRSITPSEVSGPFGLFDFPLKMDRYDLTYPYFAEADIGDFSDQLVAINLFNSHVFLSNCPPIYNFFNCSASNDTCEEYKEVRDHADFPYYIIEGYRIFVNMTLGNYGKGEQVKAIYGDLCTSNCYNNDKIVGTVGLSLNDSNFNHLVAEGDRFSIWLERDGSDGELIFGEDSDHETNEPFIILNNVSVNWEVPMLTITLLDSVYSVSGQAIFDINSNFIGIPDRIHWHLMKDLKKKFQFICIKGTITPNCTFTGDINSLPSLIFTHGDGETLITIPPAIYTRKLEANLYRSLLVSLKENPKHLHQVPVTKAYSNYVIFGSPFMQYYYTVFNYTDVKDPQIRLYVPSGGSGVSGLSAWAVIGIILGALLLIGIIVGSVMAFKKNREKQRQESLVNPESRVGYISYNQ